MNKIKNLLFSTSLLMAACFGSLSTVNAAGITTSDSTGWMTIGKGDPELSAFVDSVENGQSNLLTGVYISDTLAYPVVQQPVNNAGYVSSQPDTVTQFKLAEEYGSVGILAHNTLAGADFTEIREGDNLVLVYGNGMIRNFHVNHIYSYQALIPDSPYSSFVDLSDPEQRISADELFYKIYGVSDRVVLQTCIEKDGDLSWGRLFITATPYEPVGDYLRGTLQQFTSPL